MMALFMLLMATMSHAKRLNLNTGLEPVPYSSPISLPDGRQLCKNVFDKSSKPTVDRPGQGQNHEKMNHVFAQWHFTPIDANSGSLSVYNLCQLYVSPHGEVRVNHAQYAKDPDNDDLARSTWILSEPMTTGSWKGTISLRDGRQLYAKKDGGLSVALPFSADNTEAARRIWSFPSAPKIEPKNLELDNELGTNNKFSLWSFPSAPKMEPMELDREAGTYYKFSIGAWGGDEIEIKLSPNDNIAMINMKIASQLAKQGIVKTLPEFYENWRVVFVSPGQENSDPTACLRNLDIDPNVVHKVIPSSVPVVYRRSRSKENIGTDPTVGQKPIASTVPVVYRRSRKKTNSR